jgi:hypothetical protein
LHSAGFELADELMNCGCRHPARYGALGSVRNGSKADPEADVRLGWKADIRMPSC